MDLKGVTTLELVAELVERVQQVDKEREDTNLQTTYLRGQILALEGQIAKMKAVSISKPLPPEKDRSLPELFMAIGVESAHDIELKLGGHSIFFAKNRHMASAENTEWVQLTYGEYTLLRTLGLTPTDANGEPVGEPIGGAVAVERLKPEQAEKVAVDVSDLTPAACKTCGGEGVFLRTKNPCPDCLGTRLELSREQRMYLKITLPMLGKPDFEGVEDFRRLAGLDEENPPPGLAEGMDAVRKAQDLHPRHTPHRKAY